MDRNDVFRVIMSVHVCLSISAAIEFEEVATITPPLPPFPSSLQHAPSPTSNALLFFDGDENINTPSFTGSVTVPQDEPPVVKVEKKREGGTVNFPNFL